MDCKQDSFLCLGVNMLQFFILPLCQEGLCVGVFMFLGFYFCKVLLYYPAALRDKNKREQSVPDLQGYC